MTEREVKDMAHIHNTPASILSDEIRRAYDLIDRYIMIINRDFTVEFCNLKVRNEIGDVTGRPCYEVFCHETSLPKDCPLKKTMEFGSANSRIERCNDKHIHFAVQPFSSDKEGISLALIMGLDITEMMEVGRKERESREMLESLFNSIGDPITIHAPDYTILDANISALNLLGMKKEDVVGKKCYEVFHQTNHPIAKCPMKRTLLKGNMEKSLIGQPDLNGDYLVNTTPVFDKNGRIIRILHSVKDVTELKEMERKLTRDNERLLMFGDLITHDMGNYSQGALLAIDMLLADETLSPKQRRYLEMARIQMQSAHQLLENAKKLSRLYEEKIEVTPVDAGIVLMKVISQLKKTYASRNIRINTEVKMGTHTVLADELLFDVFINIIGNSIKYTTLDPAVVDVMAEVWDEDPSFYRFEIIDRAGGIPKEYKKSIFARFERYNSSSPGSGLGLTLVKKIVENYGGKIWVEDFTADGEVKGSAFIILLKRG